MLLFPNAKINIGLQIIEKRPDGFHNIESCFYPVNWCDVLEIVPAPQPDPSDRPVGEFHTGVVFTTSGLPILGDENSNLCIKAIKLLNEKFPLQGVRGYLHKVIPMGAGLGGGSSDGAFTLKALNEIYDLQLITAELQDYAGKLGSDCAFFIENKPVFCYEKGDKFEDISLNLAGKFVVLVNPAVHISTAEAYSGVIPRKPEISLKEALKLPINKWKGIIQNDFEEKLLLKYPVIAEVKNQLYESGAVYASMTGSGSTVYGIFENEIDLKSKFQDFAVWQGFLQ
jgi:4-diphosphocytidyl-2-C-methyl-D-erythritol kinase